MAIEADAACRYSGGSMLGYEAECMLGSSAPPAAAMAAMAAAPPAVPSEEWPPAGNMLAAKAEPSLVGEVDVRPSALTC